MIALRRGLEVNENESSSALDLLRASPMSQIVFRETHVCPVGEHCPAEVVAEIGGERRCGVCPLACKCIEHLPAIVAKQRQLLERIQGSREAYNRLAQRKTEVSELGEIYDAIDADFQDYMGCWPRKFSRIYTSDSDPILKCCMPQIPKSFASISAGL